MAIPSKNVFFQGFTWTGHFIEKKISLEKFLRVNGVLGVPRARARAPKRSQNWSHCDQDPFHPKDAFQRKVC